jgi:hypothetical protein
MSSGCYQEHIQVQLNSARSHRAISSCFADGAMSRFEVNVICHELARQKSSDLLVTKAKCAISLMKYAKQERICADLRSFFGGVRVLDGGVESYTDPEATGDHKGTVWKLPDCPCLKSIEDVADSIVAAHELQVCIKRSQLLASTVTAPLLTFAQSTREARRRIRRRHQHSNIMIRPCDCIVCAGGSRGRLELRCQTASCHVGAMLVAREQQTKDVSAKVQIDCKERLSTDWKCRGGQGC